MEKEQYHDTKGATFSLHTYEYKSRYLSLFVCNLFQ